MYILCFCPGRRKSSRFVIINYEGSSSLLPSLSKQEKAVSKYKADKVAYVHFVPVKASVAVSKYKLDKVGYVYFVPV